MIKEQINITGYNGYTEGEGSFCTVGSSFVCGYIFYCREEFANVFKKSTKYICFNQSKLNIVKLSEFFDNIHKNLKLKPMIFHPTNRHDTTLIEVPLFWRENFVRRSIFTLLLRSGTFYKKGIEPAIKSYHLSAKCSNALSFFLKGNIVNAFRRWPDYQLGFVDSFPNDRRDFKKYFTKRSLKKS